MTGPYSQNFLCEIHKIFVTLGLNILRFSRLSVFWSNYHLKLMLHTIKIIKWLFLCVIASQIHLKVTNILRICSQKFCEYALPDCWLSFQSDQSLAAQIERSARLRCRWLSNLSMLHHCCSEGGKIHLKQIIIRVLTRLILFLNISLFHILAPSSARGSTCGVIMITWLQLPNRTTSVFRYIIMLSPLYLH